MHRHPNQPSGPFKKSFRASCRYPFLALAIITCHLILPAGAGAQAGPSQKLWTPCGFSAGGLFPVLAVDPLDPATVYLGSDVSGVYRSFDFGESWYPTNQGLTSREISALAVHPADSRRVLSGTPEGLFHSLDRGHSWEKISDQIRCFKHVSYHPISFSPDGHHLLAASHRLSGETDGFGNGRFSAVLYYSSDNGETWKAVLQMPEHRLSAVMFDPLNSSRAFLVVRDRGVMVSSDSGRTWKPFSKGLAGQSGLKNIAIGKECIYLAGVPSKVFVSPKTDPDWQPINSGIPEPETGFLPAAPIAVSPESDQIVYLGQAGWPSVLYRSDNGGRTWQGSRVPEGYRFDTFAAPFQQWVDPWQAPFCIAADPQEADRIYYTSWYGVWRSDDGGHTWQEKVRGTQNTCCTAVLPTGGTLITAHMDVGLLLRGAGELQWTSGWPRLKPDYEDLHAWSLERAADEKIFAALSTNRGPRVVRSDDNGSRWQDTSTGLPDQKVEDFFHVSLAADPADPETLYLAVDQLGEKGLFRTENAGERWHQLTACPGSGSGEDRVVKCLEVDVDDSSRLYAGLYWDGLWFSDNGGRSWKRSAAQNESIAGSSVQEILSLGGDGVLAALDTGLYISRDKGLSFARISPKLPQLGEDTIEYTTTVAVDPDHPQTLFFATAKNYPIWHNRGSVYRSVDGGENWRDISEDLPIRNVVDLAVADGYLYAATWCANVYRCRLDAINPPNGK